MRLVTFTFNTHILWSMVPKKDLINAINSREVVRKILKIFKYKVDAILFQWHTSWIISSCERLVNKSSVVLSPQPPSPRHSLCCQRSGSRAGLVQLHMFRACSQASLPPFPFHLTCAWLRWKWKGRGYCAHRLCFWPIRGVSTPCLFPSQLCSPLPPPLDTPSKGEKKCTKSSFWVLLSVALLLKRCQCVCGAFTLLPH